MKSWSVFLGFNQMKYRKTTLIVHLIQLLCFFFTSIQIGDFQLNWVDVRGLGWTGDRWQSHLDWAGELGRRFLDGPAMKNIIKYSSPQSPKEIEKQNPTKTVMDYRNYRISYLFFSGCQMAMANSQTFETGRVLHESGINGTDEACQLESTDALLHLLCCWGMEESEPWRVYTLDTLW